MIGSLVEDDARKRVEVKCCLRNLQDLCHTKRRKMLEAVSKVVGLVVKWVGDTVVVTSPGAVNVADQCVNELTGQLASARVEVVLLTVEL